MVEFRSDMKVELAQHMGSEAFIVHAAKTSTLGAESPRHDETKGFLGWLTRERHKLPFEHAVLTFRFEVPIFVSRQIVKYRHTSISEESGRYREMESVFYVPDDNRPVVQVGKTGDYRFEHDYQSVLTARNTMIINSRESWTKYQGLLDFGIAKEVARMVLPVNLYSTMVVTGNLIHWLHFISQRATASASHGQYEIAEVADKVALEIEKLYPTVWAKFVENGYVL